MCLEWHEVEKITTIYISAWAIPLKDTMTVMLNAHASYKTQTKDTQVKSFKYKFHHAFGEAAPFSFLRERERFEKGSEKNQK